MTKRDRDVKQDTSKDEKQGAEQAAPAESKGPLAWFKKQAERFRRPKPDVEDAASEIGIQPGQEIPQIPTIDVANQIRVGAEVRTEGPPEVPEAGSEASGDIVIVVDYLDAEEAEKVLEQGGVTNDTEAEVLVEIADEEGSAVADYRTFSDEIRSLEQFRHKNIVSPVQQATAAMREAKGSKYYEDQDFIASRNRFWAQEIDLGGRRSSRQEIDRYIVETVHDLSEARESVEAELLAESLEQGTFDSLPSETQQELLVVFDDRLNKDISDLGEDLDKERTKLLDPKEQSPETVRDLTIPPRENSMDYFDAIAPDYQELDSDLKKKQADLKTVAAMSEADEKGFSGDKKANYVKAVRLIETSNVDNLYARGKQVSAALESVGLSDESAGLGEMFDQRKKELASAEVRKLNDALEISKVDFMKYFVAQRTSVRKRDSKRQLQSVELSDFAQVGPKDSFEILKGTPLANRLEEYNKFKDYAEKRIKVFEPLV